MVLKKIFDTFSVCDAFVCGGERAAVVRAVCGEADANTRC